MLSMDELDILQAKALTMADPIFDYTAKDVAELLRLAGQLNTTAAYRLLRARAIGVQYEELLRRVSELSDWAEVEISRMLLDTAARFYEGDRLRLQADVPEFRDNLVLQQITRAAIKDALVEFQSATRSIGFLDEQGRALPMREYYARTVDYVFHNVVNGTMTVEAAVRIATDRLVGTDRVPGGIRTIDYASGVHTGTEAAVRRAILGGLAAIVEDVSGYNHKAMGATGWEISAHANSAYDHEPIQGRQLTDEEYAELITNDSTVREIGQFHCRHLRFSVVVGVTPPLNTPEYLQQLERENAQGVTIDGTHYTGYGATQRMNDIEQSIRRWEKRQLMAEESGCDKEIRRSVSGVSGARQRYDRFSRLSGLAKRPYRLYVSGWGRSQGAKVAAETRRQKSV